MKKIGKWLRKSSKRVYENNWIAVDHDEVLNPNGGEGIYGRVHFKNLAVGVVPIDEEGYTYLVGQHRYPLDVYSWEIPEGGCPIDTDPLETAKRELQEETGLMAASWQAILHMHLSNSVSDEAAFLYLAQGITPGEAQPEETEDLTLKKLPISSAIEMVHQGEISDAMSVSALLKIESMILKKQLEL